MSYTHAIVLCGGLGTRLGLLGKRHPKQLISLAGKTLFERYCEQFVALGITDAEWVFAERYRSEVESFLKKHREQYAMNISVVYEQTPRGITQALLDQAPKVLDATLFLMGDVFFTDPFATDCPDVDETIPMALGVSQPPAKAMSDNCNIAFAEDNLITRIHDKPKPDETNGPWAWDGWFLVHPALFRHLAGLHIDPEKLRHYLLGDLFERVRASGVAFRAVPGSHWHININTRADIHAAEEYLEQRERA